MLSTDVGTQKNRLNWMVLWSIYEIKIFFNIYAKNLTNLNL